MVTESERHPRDAIDRIFGDPLRSSEADDDDVRDVARDVERDRWLLENRPPHHQ
ncbi:hypothetical protein C731_3477 [Mycolicibacterium hassiacum DSM 44199]|jgi:hypothetical protein|uniref:Uncharacterized protein n=1 Tax=Mycolicibacterium hassiacum (strain DSM 44199 / CIP 105218 / JCM 12690 / 3849) TaxID=1122247 RepID=K5BJ50_MYCHD|nr:hypothetical protein [Mycolicibacterium hassiacum]EKF22499.1 hypothetical protein C731_3477 [Mycolicibacterium hassiacum DSM 44199]MBX5489082.1 hypothetical protein [Mycolicibacterium hassiacum]